ncbi:MAG TPA: putative Ig domain-containing protein [Woeseiaceae bacterium]|nr:putative Ig domain-containing protein [Woeseiaceae bacterium]
MGPGGGNGNAAPTISGSPAAVAVVGQQYVFTPGAADPDGDPLTFSISNRPSWAAFDTGNGRLSGVPAVGSEGTYAGIQITVSDGSLTASTPVFSVEVMQSATGSATLLWDAPSENTDGSVLTDLAAYRIYYGTSAGNYPNEILIDNPGITTYVVENLPPDTYYFVSTAINSNGIESGYSNMATAVVN